MTACFSPALKPPSSIDVPGDGLSMAETVWPQLDGSDIARRLAITEAELVEMDEGSTSARLRADWPSLLEGLRRLGPVLAQTGNAHAVLEAHGHAMFAQQRPGPVRPPGQEVELRLSLDHWCHAWATTGQGRRALQVFAADGSAVHKVLLTEDSDLSVWERLLVALAAPGLPAIDIDPAAPPAPPLFPVPPEAVMDVAAFRATWDALRDAREVSGLSGHCGADRCSAGCTWAPRQLGEARRVSPDAVVGLLRRVAAAEPLTVMVGNPGCLQTHTGLLEVVTDAGPWLQVRGADAVLYLRARAIAGGWVVATPTPQGVVTSLELFATDGTPMAMFCGRRLARDGVDPQGLAPASPLTAESWHRFAG
ncbi:Hemin transport protein HmuS [Rhodovastum atsumiense]|nr:ChuX/HutX family heme-like substrate-binding protein [Rhodovastum atsumiense]CAH2603334.1 Hemin transport protein HmuS [Rhodovastum atsumiense]